jgi:type II secretory pathway component GspD/PulD (secretin)
LVSARKVVESQEPVFAETLTEAQKKTLIQKFQEDARSNVMFAPKVTLFDGQEATVQDTIQRPFVVGVTPEDKNNPAIIRTFVEGTQIMMKTTMQAGGAVRLDLQIRLSDLLDVRTAVAGPNDLKVQVPQIRSSNIQLSAVVPAGRCRAIWGFEDEITATVERPFLKGVPYVSRMFKNTATGTMSQDTLMVITPQVLELADNTN